MPEELERKYEVRISTLEHVSNSLEQDLRALLDDFAPDHRLQFNVLGVDDFVVAAKEHNYETPLVEVENQVSGNVSLPDVNSIREIEKKLRELYSVLEGRWSGDESQIRSLVCLIPPQSKPPGWDQRDDLPNTYTLVIEASDSVESSTLEPTATVPFADPSTSSAKESEPEKLDKEGLFDVFLAHNSKDKPVVKEIAAQLSKHGIISWIDSQQIAPGRSFQDEIQSAIAEAKAVAICIGEEGTGKWQEWELKASITQCVENNIPVIPVLLPGANKLPNSLLFLAELNWVKFEHANDETAVLRLKWGVTGNKPASLDGVSQTTTNTPASDDVLSSMGQPGRSSGVIFALHGIRTHAAWHRTLYEVLGNYAWQVRTERWTFGKFSIFKFLSPWARSAKVKWFRKVYSDETQDRRVQLSKRQRPSAVAHSFGTYILGNAMLKYDSLRFDKIILCGSILPRDFPWDQLIERGQVNFVRNEYGVNDIWVRLVGWFVPDTGPSGHSGFACQHDRLEQENFLFEHSEYFDSGHMEAKWLPFLQNRIEDFPVSEMGVSRPKRKYPLGLYFGYALILAILGLAGWQQFNGRPQSPDVSAKDSEAPFSDDGTTEIVIVETAAKLKKELATRLDANVLRGSSDLRFQNFEYKLIEVEDSNVKIEVSCTASGSRGNLKFNSVKVNWDLIVKRIQTGTLELVNETLQVQEGNAVREAIQIALSDYFESLQALNTEKGYQLKKDLAARLDANVLWGNGDVKFRRFRFRLKEVDGGNVKLEITCQASGDYRVFRSFDDVEVNWELIVKQNSNGTLEIVEEKLNVRDNSEVKSKIQDVLSDYVKKLRLNRSSNGQDVQKER